MSEIVESFDDILNLDPLALAEKMTGASYKNDDNTMTLGYQLMLLNENRKKEELALRGDSYRNISFNSFIRIVLNEGFEEIYFEEFEGEPMASEKETFMVFWKEGLLLTAESFGDYLNSSTVYFNVKIFDRSNPFSSLPLSGHTVLTEDKKHKVWSGSMDMREAFIHKLQKLYAYGEPLTEWIDSPFVWLLNYSDSKTKDYDYNVINRRKMSYFPKNIQESIIL